MDWAVGLTVRIRRVTCEPGCPPLAAHLGRSTRSQGGGGWGMTRWGGAGDRWVAAPRSASYSEAKVNGWVCGARVARPWPRFGRDRGAVNRGET